MWNVYGVWRSVPGWAALDLDGTQAIPVDVTWSFCPAEPWSVVLEVLIPHSGAAVRREFDRDLLWQSLTSPGAHGVGRVSLARIMELNLYGEPVEGTGTAAFGGGARMRPAAGVVAGAMQGWWSAGATVGPVGQGNEYVYVLLNDEFDPVVIRVSAADVEAFAHMVQASLPQHEESPVAEVERWLHSS